MKSWFNNFNGIVFVLPFVAVIILIVSNITICFIKTYFSKNNYRQPPAVFGINSICNLLAESGLSQISQELNKLNNNNVITNDSITQTLTTNGAVQNTSNANDSTDNWANTQGLIGDETTQNASNDNTTTAGEDANTDQTITQNSTGDETTQNASNDNTTSGATFNSIQTTTQSNSNGVINRVITTTSESKILPTAYPIDSAAQISIKNIDLIYTISVQSSAAKKVEFYIQKENTATPLYLGMAVLGQNNIWEYSFNSQNYPNGSYSLYGLLTENNGIFQTPVINFSINKLVVSSKPELETTPATQTMITQLDSAKQQLDLIYKNIDQASESAVKEINENLNPQEAKKVNSNINELVKTIQTVEQLKDLLAQKQSQRNTLSQEIVALQIQYQNLPADALDSIRQDLLAQIHDKQSQKDQLDADIQTIQEAIDQKNNEKNSLSSEIIELTKTLDKNTTGMLTEIENSVSQNQQIANDLLKQMQKDSDGDGLNDYEEVYIYHTNSINPDTDDDGFLDGDEVAHSFDPLKAGDHKNSASIAYQDPRTVPPRQTDLYKVNLVQSVKLASGGTGIKLQGQGLPNSFITLFIYSQPIIVIVKTDNAGRWEYILDKPLDDGQHTVLAAQTDSAGSIVARSQEFIFLKNGANVAQTISGNLGPDVSGAKRFENDFRFYTIFAIILAMAIAFLIISFAARTKNNI